MVELSLSVESQEKRIQELEETISFLEVKVQNLDDALVELNNSYHELKLDNQAIKSIVQKIAQGSGGEMGDIVREEPSNGVNR